MKRGDEVRHLFTPNDFGWKLRMRQGAKSFFSETAAADSPQKERLHWLDTAPELCLASSPKGDALIQDCWKLAADWEMLPTPVSEGKLIDLGCFWEPDFILLDGATFTLAAGCVCMASSWDLQDSVGKTLDEIHGRVPGLNRSIGHSITRFLERIPADQSFYRENWSLTRSNHLNYHPALQRPRLNSSISPNEINLRIEHQSFVKIPHGVLMGIRINPIALTELSDEPEILQGLHQQLSTMPEEVAIYKGLDAGIAKVIEVISDMI